MSASRWKSACVAAADQRTLWRMPEISSENVWVALLVTLAAGLATGLGSLMVLFSRRPNPRLLAFGLAFAGGAMVFVSLTEILTKAIDSFTQAYDARVGY